VFMGSSIPHMGCKFPVGGGIYNPSLPLRKSKRSRTHGAQPLRSTRTTPLDIGPELVHTQIMPPSNKHIGASFDDFLAEENLLVECETRAPKKILVLKIENGE
jgi:hypothetical protein